MHLPLLAAAAPGYFGLYRLLVDLTAASLTKVSARVIDRNLSKANIVLHM
jgi:hypothetical protein